MGRRALSRKLIVWMNGIPVGEWENGPRGDRLSYFDTWLAHEQGRPLSLSLPFLPGNGAYHGELVSRYFDNLLPDNDTIRRRLAQRHQTGGIEAFQLLHTLGRDCVGAIQLLPPDETPNDLFQISGTPLSEAEIAQRLRNTTAPQTFGRHASDDDLRLSIAGAQEKTALLDHQGRWQLPEGSTPTTHIFKLPLGLVGNRGADMRTSVENEWLCSQIVRAFGLPIAHCHIAHFEDQKVLVVARFDRRRSQNRKWIVRLPQEDMCQATGTSPLHKYQADGGPGIAAIMGVLLGSDRAEKDRLNFFKTQLVFWLLAATDGHAKNFSIALQPGGHYVSTPLYDVLSAHPVIGNGANQIAPQKARLAMAVRGSTPYYLIDKIHRRHWLAQAQQTGLGAKLAEQLIEEVLSQAETVIADVAQALPDDFPMDMADAIFQGIRRHADRLTNSPQ